MNEVEPSKPVARRFRRAAGPPPDKRMVQRQMSATAHAYRVLGSVDDARAFLNAHHDGLVGRPVDIAGATDAGYEAVIDVLDGCRPAEHRIV